MRSNAMKKTLYGCVLACAAALILAAGSVYAGSKNAAAAIDPEAQKIVKAFSNFNKQRREYQI